MSATSIVILCVAGYLAWLASTLGGGGGGMLLIPVITYIKELGPRAVAPVLAVVTMVDSPVRVFLFRHHIDWKIVRWYLPGAVTGAFLGSVVFANTEARWLKVLAALFLLSTVVQFRFGEEARSFPMRVWGFLPLGFVVSFVSGLIGEAGPVLNPFYLNYGVVKERMIGTKSVNSFFMQLTKIATYYKFGALDWPLLKVGLMIGVCAMAASWTGKLLLGRMDAKQFRMMVVVVMAVTGAWMLWQEREVLTRLFT